MKNPLIETTLRALNEMPGPQVRDIVTAVRAYAAFSRAIPSDPQYREKVRTSLKRLKMAAHEHHRFDLEREVESLLEVAASGVAFDSDPTDSLEFVRAVSGLRKLANLKGDTATTAALDECLLKTTGGSPGCPFGNLILSQYSPDVPPPAAAMEESPTLVKLDQIPKSDTEFAAEVLHPMAIRAMADQNPELVKAIEDCEHMTGNDPRCPLYRLFHEKADRRVSMTSRHINHQFSDFCSVTPAVC